MLLLIAAFHVNHKAVLQFILEYWWSPKTSYSYLFIVFSFIQGIFTVRDKKLHLDADAGAEVFSLTSWTRVIIHVRSILLSCFFYRWNLVANSLRLLFLLYLIVTDKLWCTVSLNLSRTDCMSHCDVITMTTWFMSIFLLSSVVKLAFLMSNL